MSRSWNPDPVCPSVEVLKPRSRLSVYWGTETQIPNCKSKITAQKPAWLLFSGFSWNLAIMWGFFEITRTDNDSLILIFFFKYPELVILWLWVLIYYINCVGLFVYDVTILFFSFYGRTGLYIFYGRTSLYIFQMALPRVNIRVFFFFFLRPFPAGSLCRQVCSSIPIFDSTNYT